MEERGRLLALQEEGRAPWAALCTLHLLDHLHCKKPEST